MFLSVIIPAYNEEKSIVRATEEVAKYFSSRNFNFEIIVVNDGSSDKTSEAVLGLVNKYPNLQLLENEKNQGKGFSVRKGVLASCGDWILFLDADLSTNPQEFENFEPFMSTHNIMIGSRAVHGARTLKHQPFFRELLGKLANKIIRFVLGLSYRDTQCGFKLFSSKVKVLFEQQRLDRWLFDVELLYLAKKHDFCVKELPVTWNNDPITTVKNIDILMTPKELYLIKKYHG